MRNKDDDAATLLSICTLRSSPMTCVGDALFFNDLVSEASVTFESKEQNDG